jgi:hypothetical protein
MGVSSIATLLGLALIILLTVLGGPMAALLILRRQAAPDEVKPIRRMTGQLLILALLTQLVYPVVYPGLPGSPRSRDDHHLNCRDDHAQPRSGHIYS